MLRRIILWLLFAKYRITHRNLTFKGWSVICPLSGGNIKMGGVLRYYQVFPVTC